ncbi:MAG: acyltransferase [Marinilabiliaceae bacterium]|nr:acyltransferase [Marinilabiliaceae bacterium]
MGHHTRIGIGSVLIGPVLVGDHVRLAQNVVISALNHNYEDVTRPISEQGVHTDPVTIDDETWIGANVTILPGRHIGKHCIVAAGSVVTKDVPSYSVVAGNPAKVIKTYHPESNTWQRISA